MKEIIVAGIGSCGINLTSSYLSLMNEEHDLHPYEDLPFHNELQVHFQKPDKKSPISRFIFIDSNPMPIDNILSNSFASQINPDNLISGTNSSVNLFSNGYHGCHYLYDQIIDSFRKEFEKCESLQSVIINNSIIGGTGSGLGMGIIEKLQEQYNKHIFITNSIIPTLSEIDSINDLNILGIYNSVLSLTKMDDYQMFCILNDNESLFKISSVESNFSRNSYNIPNNICSKSLSALTSGSQFPGLMPSNIRKIMTNIIHSPRFHFFSSFYYEDFDNRTNFVNYTFNQMIENKKSLFKITDENYNLITTSSFFRGNNFYSSELEEINTNNFVRKEYYWLQNHFCGHCYNPERKNSREAVYFNQGTYFGKTFKNMRAKFTKAFQRKAFLHWYTANGMEELDFVTAESFIDDMVYEYLYTAAGVIYD